MRLWRILTGRRVPPLGDPVGELFVAPETLALQQERACARLGLALEDLPGLGPLRVGPGLVLFDDAFVNAAALDHLRAQAGADLAALCLADDALGRFVQPGLGLTARPAEAVPVGLFALPETVEAADATALRERLHARARPVLLPAAPVERERLPGFPTRQPVLEIPRGAAVAARVATWPQLLWLNQALAYAPTAGGDRRGNHVAADARVHPRAHLERCRVGPRSVVEPGATLHDCWIGADCHVGDRSALRGCALGDGCQTLADTLLVRVVALAGATLSSLGLEEVLVGRRAFVTTAAIFFATRLGDDPQVHLDGQAVRCGRPRLGGCVGHGAVLGARAIFEPGCAVPGHATVVMRPEEGVARIAVEAGAVACWDRATLRPVQAVFPGHRPPEFAATGFAARHPAVEENP